MAGRLGLQASIGEDLRALVKGWVPIKTFDAFFRWAYRASAACVAIGCWLRLTGYVPLYNGTFPAAKGVSPSSALWLSILVFAAQLVVYWWLDRGGRKKKILLVVDDLDRCDPSHLLTVVESIKLLLEEPSVAQRVQAVMLVEEEILKHAIYEKYGALTDVKRREELALTYNLDRLVRENAEKLFNAHLRLSPLTTKDVVELVKKFGGRMTNLKARLAAADNRLAAARSRIAEEAKGPDDGSQGQADEHYLPLNAGEYIGHVSNPTEPSASAADSQSSDLERQTARRDFDDATAERQRLQTELESVSTLEPRVKWSLTGAILDEEEIGAIVHALSVPMETYRNTVGPRAIRSFLFRYQLARLLALRLGVRFTQSTLAQVLAEHYLGIDPPSKALEDEPQFDLTPLRKMVAQVS